ncbi:MAG TPA: hypothetical protein PLE95_10430 [Bacteroidales bacterium]|nr:hypothetical protein [Bacteroidales bacterium]
MHRKISGGGCAGIKKTNRKECKAVNAMACDLEYLPHYHFIQRILNDTSS